MPLQLTRSKNEEIVIELPDGREVVIAPLDGPKRNIAIEAPRQLRIYRRPARDIMVRTEE